MRTIDLTPVSHPHEKCGQNHPLGPCPWRKGDHVENGQYGRGVVMEDHEGHGLVRVVLEDNSILLLHPSMERLYHANSNSYFYRVNS